MAWRVTVCLLAAIIIACSHPAETSRPPEPPNEPLVAAVKFDAFQPKLLVGVWTTLRATARDAKGGIKWNIVSYQVLDPALLELADSGGVAWTRGRRPGRGRVLARVDTASAVAEIDLLPPIQLEQMTFSAGLACGLTPEGAAYCWDADYWSQRYPWNATSQGNLAGQLGTGNLIGSNSPVPVVGGYVFTRLSIGGSHVCGIRSDQRLFCWGRNDFGQTGNGAPTPPGQGGGVLTPTEAMGGQHYTSVVLSAFFTCGVTVEGEAHCWGDGRRGALGTGSDAPVAMPTPVGGNLRWITLAVAPDIGGPTCGVDSHGVTHCWGDLTRFGSGPTLVPARLESAVQFESLSVAVDHACGLTAGGKAYCWGSNDSRQLGTAEAPNRCGDLPCALSPVLVATALRFTSIQAVANNTCALATDQALYCWGAAPCVQWSTWDGFPIGCLEWTNSPSPTLWTPTSAMSFRSFSVGNPFYLEGCGMSTEGIAYCWFFFSAPRRVPGQIQ